MLTGAVFADGVSSPSAFSAVSPLHFGEPFREQREFVAGRAIMPLLDYGIVRLAGEDRLRLLHSLTSQKLDDLLPGEGRETLLLTPQGRVEAQLRVVDDGSVTWLLTDPGYAAMVADFFVRMRFMLRVEVADVSADFTLLACWGGAGVAAQLLQEFAAAWWVDPWPKVQPGGAGYAGDAHPGADWDLRLAVVSRTALSPLFAAAENRGVAGAGVLTLAALSVYAARPSQRWGVDEKALPHEFDWLRTAVHLQKGCYRGQETVAKVHNLGHPPRRLTLLHLDGMQQEQPSAGDAVVLAADPAKQVGVVAVAAEHFEWGGVALALLRRQVAEDAALCVVTAGGQRIAAAQQVIVPAAAGGENRARIAARMQLRGGSRRPAAGV